MTTSDDQARYVPMGGTSAAESAKYRPFSLSELSVIGVVMLCERGIPSSVRPERTLYVTMTQYVRLSDASMIRLDMDRGLSSFYHGPANPVSWKSSAREVIDELLTLIQDEATAPDAFPWDAFAEAARIRGIDVDAETLRGLPYTVMMSDELMEIYEF